MIIKNIITTSTLATSIATLLLLSGCISSEKKADSQQKNSSTHRTPSPSTAETSHADSGPRTVDDGSEVVATINGVPVVTEKSLEEFVNDWAEENEQARMIIQASPEQAKLGLLEGRVNTELVIMKAKEILASDVQAKQKFEDQLAKGIDRLKAVLYQEVFKDSVTEPAVSEADIVAFYDENKESNPFLRIKAGGIRAVAIQFTDNDEANQFYQAVVNKPASFEEVAEEAELEDKVRQLGLVSAQSYGVDPAIKDTLEGLTSFPSVQIIPIADENIWVVAALEKQRPEYRSIDESREPIREALAQQKHEEALINEIEKLKKQYNINYNEDYMSTLKNKAAQRRLELEKQFGFSLDEDGDIDFDEGN